MGTALISPNMNNHVLFYFGLCTQPPGWSFPPHQHSVFEIQHCYAGKARQRIDDAVFEFKKGDWLFINSGIRHATENKGNEGFSYFVIHFDVDDPLLRKQLKSIDVSHIPPEITANTTLLDCFHEIKQAIHHKAQENKLVILDSLDFSVLEKLTIQANLLLLIRNIFIVYEKMNMEKKHSNCEFSSVEMEIADKVASALEESGDNPVLIQEVANQIGISRARCTQIFTKVYGVPPRQYLTDLTIKKAKELLVNTNLTVCEISVQLGFSSVSHFSKQFKRWTGQSPNQFRPKHTRNAVLSN